MNNKHSSFGKILAASLFCISLLFGNHASAHGNHYETEMLADRQQEVVLALTTFGFSPAPYDVVWDSPSTDQTGPMPIGNGNLAAGVYAIEDDALYLLLSKNDALTYNGDLFKTGRVRIALDPNPFAEGKPLSTGASSRQLGPQM